MAEKFWSSDWLSQNATRLYPLCDTATGEDNTGSFTLPTDFLVDMVFTVEANEYTDPGSFHIATITAFDNGVVVTIGYDGDIIGTASVAQATFTDYSRYPLVGQGEFENSRGSITVGSLATIMNLPAGIWEFSVENGRLSPSVVRPALSGVSSMRFVSGGDVSDPLRGDIELVAGMNFRFRVFPESDRTVIYLDCIDGEGTVEDYDCDEMPADAPPIRTINGVPPNAAGNIDISGSSCISMTPVSNGIWFQDLCSEPCCGCEELEIITAALNNLDSQVTTLNSYSQRLDGNISQLLKNVIGSKTSDIPSD